MLLKRGEAFIINKLCKHMKLKKVLQNHESRISSNEEIISFIKDEMATKTDLKELGVELRAEMATKIDLEQMRVEMATKDDLQQLREDIKSDVGTKIDAFVGLYTRIDVEQVAMKYHRHRYDKNFEKIEGELNLGLEY